MLCSAGSLSACVYALSLHIWSLIHISVWIPQWLLQGYYIFYVPLTIKGARSSSSFKVKGIKSMSVGMLDLPGFLWDTFLNAFSDLFICHKRDFLMLKTNRVKFPAFIVSDSLSNPLTLEGWRTTSEPYTSLADQTSCTHLWGLFSTQATLKAQFLKK